MLNVLKLAGNFRSKSDLSLFIYVVIIGHYQKSMEKIMLKVIFFGKKGKEKPRKNVSTNKYNIKIA